MQRILIIEDDEAIAAIEQAYLRRAGYDPAIAYDGKEGLREALDGGYDLILLDVMLPGIDGFTILRQIRQEQDIPVLLVTALGEDADKIKGFGLGADDFIEKPFSPRVLVARVKAKLARYGELTRAKETPQAKPLRFGSLVIDPRSHEVSKCGTPVTLTNKEYELLLFLARHPSAVYGKDELYDRIWGQDAMGDTATVAVHINRLREKLEDDPAHPAHLVTVRGAGYKWV